MKVTAINGSPRGRHSSTHGVCGPIGVPVDRDLSAVEQELSDQRDLEDRLLAQEARRPAVVPQQMSHGQRVEP